MTQLEIRPSILLLVIIIVCPKGIIIFVLPKIVTFIIPKFLIPVVAKAIVFHIIPIRIILHATIKVIIFVKNTVIHRHGITYKIREKAIIYITRQI